MQARIKWNRIKLVRTKTDRIMQARIKLARTKTDRIKMDRTQGHGHRPSCRNAGFCPFSCSVQRIGLGRTFLLVTRPWA